MTICTTKLEKCTVVDTYIYLDLSMIYEIAASLGLTNISVYMYTTILVTRIFNVLERPHI